MKMLLVILISYLFGSVPWALVIGKLFYHKDIRTEGSGNLGASNAGRVLGKKAAVAVTVLDASKAILSMYVATKIAPGTELFAGLACCIGHCFPVFAGFHGGKAVATSYGFMFGICLFMTHQWIWQFLLPVAVFFLVLYLTKMVSVSSITSLLAEVIVSFILVPVKGIDVKIPLALLALWCFVTYRHKSNLLRIKNGTENKIKWMG